MVEQVMFCISMTVPILHNHLVQDPTPVSPARPEISESSSACWGHVFGTSKCFTLLFAVMLCSLMCAIVLSSSMHTWHKGAVHAAEPVLVTRPSEQTCLHYCLGRRQYTVLPLYLVPLQVVRCLNQVFTMA